MKPLSNKSRLLSGILLTIIFIIITPIILLKSFGYEFKKVENIFKVVKTGGVYIHSDHSNAVLYLNDERYEEAGFFSKNFLVQNLEPNKEYNFAVKKDGYNDWNKKLKAFESVVIEARVLMLPKIINKREIKSDIVEIDKNATTTKVVATTSIQNNIKDDSEYYKTSLLFEEKKEETVDIKNNTKQSTSTKEIVKDPNILSLLEKLQIKDENELQNLIIKKDEVAFLKDGNINLYWLNYKTPPYYYCFELNNCPSDIILDIPKDVLRFDFLPSRNDVFVALLDDGIFAIEIDPRGDRNIQPLYLGANLDFRKNESEKIIVKDAEIFYEIDF